MISKPWAEGPIELLKHGMDHLTLDTSFDNRMAMICIDNSVELMIKTYLGLPKRVTGIAGLKREDYEKIIKSFPRMLDAFESFAPDKIVGFELGDIEWYHRLRNELYHEGNGITVEREKVEPYAEIAKILLSNLFSLTLDKLPIHLEVSEIGKFLIVWAKVEKQIYKIGKDNSHSKSFFPVSIPALVEDLSRRGELAQSVKDQFLELGQFRRLVLQGDFAASSKELRKRLNDLEDLERKLSGPNRDSKKGSG
ncbi:MAG: hypothetical protein ACYCPW_06790 [Nitrososphaerales archaeon]